jgi:hypothetical protein
MSVVGAEKVVRFGYKMHLGKADGPGGRDGPVPRCWCGKGVKHRRAVTYDLAGFLGLEKSKRCSCCYRAWRAGRERLGDDVDMLERLICV